MNTVVTWLILIIMAIVGGGTTAVIVLMVPGVLIWKIYRKIKYGYKLTD